MGLLGAVVRYSRFPIAGVTALQLLGFFLIAVAAVPAFLACRLTNGATVALYMLLQVVAGLSGVALIGAHTTMTFRECVKTGDDNCLLIDRDGANDVLNHLSGN